MKKIVALSTILIVFMGCKKDDPSGDKPKLTFKSVSTTDVAKGEDLVIFTFDLQDANGDTENTMNINDIRFGDETKFEPVFMPLLESHKGTKLKAEVQLYVSDQMAVRMKLRDGVSPITNPDTLQYRVFVLDNAGNSSDTILLPKVAIHN